MDFREIAQINFLTNGVNGTQKVEYDGNGNILYYGFAEPGSATSAPRWQIRKFTYSLTGGVYQFTDVQFASGDATPNKIWDNRTGYSYS